MVKSAEDFARHDAVTMLNAPSIGGIFIETELGSRPAVIL